MQKLLYYILYPILWLVSKLPLRVLYVFSDFLCFLANTVFSYRKGTVLRNITLAFPRKSEDGKQQIASKFYHHLCDIVVETIKSISISESEIKKRFNVTNKAVIEDLYNKDRSVLLMCGHYASWEWSGILNILLPHKCYAVYKKLRNKQFDGLIKRIRERFGGTIMRNNKIVPELFRNKRDNIKSLTLILSDQSPRKAAAKHWDTFMGIDVPVFTGTEDLAKKLNFVPVYLKVEKVKRGYYNATFEVLAEDPKELEDYQLTRLFLDQVEQQIKKEPAYYLWSHKRWKHRQALN